MCYRLIFFDIVKWRIVTCDDILFKKMGLECFVDSKKCYIFRIEIENRTGCDVVLRPNQFPKNRQIIIY